MMKKGIYLTTIIILLLQIHLNGQDYRHLKDPKGLTLLTADNGIEKSVTIKVVYDNYVKEVGRKADWGYSIVIEGLDKGILFDTGTQPDIFESNFKEMGLNAADIDIIVLSHEHGDHTQGIPALVRMKSGIPVLFPLSFSEDFKKKMVDYGLEPVLVKEPAMICEHLYTSGEFAGQIPEQALVLNTREGLVVITGCSHPGINMMLKEIKSIFGKDIYMVFGGFHLLNKTKQEMEDLISEMKSLGVKKCGATHCTGEMQIKMFKDSFGENYFELGVGNAIVIW